MKFNKKKIKRQFLSLIKKITRVVWVLNVAIIVGMVAWLYFFIQTYYYEARSDFSFMREHIEDVSFAELDTRSIEEVREAYEGKKNNTLLLPEDIELPF